MLSILFRLDSLYVHRRKWSGDRRYRRLGCDVNSWSVLVYLLRAVRAVQAVIYSSIHEETSQPARLFHGPVHWKPKPGSAGADGSFLVITTAPLKKKVQ
jgi:hypothetical protein